MIESDLGRPNDIDRRLDTQGLTEMKGGLIGSVALHLVVLLLVGLSWPTRESPQIFEVVPVKLVRFGPQTVSPPASRTARVPQDRAEAVPTSETTEVAPTQPVQRQPKTHEATQPTIPTLRAREKPERKPDIPALANKSASRPTTAITAKHRLTPNEELAARLKSLARLRQFESRTSRSARQEDGNGISNLTAASADTPYGQNARYAVKDFIRAQVERHWNLDRMHGGARNWVVAIHIILLRDGTVRSALIVGNPRFSSDAYHDFALSARNAVLLSSPLALPAGTYAVAKDITVNFGVQQVLQ